MTERLYFTESYQQDFTARVIAVQEMDGKQMIQLDRTCFYPTSGGQAFDTGTLADLPVCDVFVDDEGTLQHVVTVPEDEHGQLPTVGAVVAGKIDWPRRHDHMQQHSGQHLLSQVFFQQCGAETVAVHFGETDATVDLAVADLSTAQVASVEEQANALIYAALPIHAYAVDEQTLSTIPLRRPPKVTGTIRIVEIDRYDYSACGGTHVQTTAEIGPLKITKVERRRNQTRVTFLCGMRAYRDYGEKHRLITEAATLFSNEIQQVPTLITRNLALLKEKERALEEAQRALLTYEAQTLVAEARMLGSVRLVQHTVQGQEVTLLKTLATQLQSYAQVVALLASTEDEKVTLCFSCDPTLTTESKLNMGQLLRTVLQPHGGKGGGKADFAQGGGISPTELPAIFTAAEQSLKELLHN
ncbi:MAG TPA: DHHA1 domain-containing protein [Caldilineaceae bacterium]|nr:DHHA1 domain-containing protein [Caldilineaceae bacterium]